MGGVTWISRRSLQRRRLPSKRSSAGSAYALERHPLCRQVKFDVVGMPRTTKGGNWTITWHTVAPDALWEASDIIADIQDAYELVAAA